MHNRTRRIDIGQSVQIKHGNEQAEGTILNVSYGGVLVSSELKININETVSIIHEEAGELSGTVSRCTDDGFAISLGESEDSAAFALSSITSEMFSEFVPKEEEQDEQTLEDEEQE